ncbi:MAG: hypothetical protein RLZ42_1352 [Armatimonadota bacterium]
MRWQDTLAITLIILSAGLQSAICGSSTNAALINMPMVVLALLSTYQRINVLVLMSALVVTRIAIGTESIPITLFRSIIATYLSVKAGMTLINRGWLLAVVTVTSCYLVDILAAIIAHPKYVSTITMTDIVVAVVFNAGITLLCAIPLELYYRKQHIHGF